jgi:ABC-type multidrug transport system ATPase subunit
MFDIHRSVDDRSTAFGKLSRGQKQRLSIALALAGRVN